MMGKSLLIVALCLFHGIASSNIQKGNSGVYDREETNFTQKVYSDEETKNSSNENETYENVESTGATDTSSTTSTTTEISSSFFQDNLTTISYDVLSNQSLITDLDTSRQSNFSSNVDLHISTVLQKTETTPGFLNDAKDTLPTSSTTENEPNLESLSTVRNFKLLTTAKENFTNIDAKISRDDDTDISIDDSSPNSSSFTSENFDGYSVTTSDPKISVSRIPLLESTLKYETTSEDTISIIADSRNFTQEENISVPILNSTEKKFFTSELLTRDGKEINSSQPTVNESHMENKEDDLESFAENATEENIPNHFLSVTNKSTFAENPLTDVSSLSSDKLATSTSLIFGEFFTTHMAKTTSSTRENVEEESFISTPDPPKQNISDYVSENAASPPSEKLLSQSYKLILTKNCSGSAFSSHTFQSLSEILNRSLNAQNSTELLKCVSVYEFNFTSDIASLHSLSDVIDIMEDTLGPDLEVSIMNYDSIIHQIPFNAQINSAYFFIPKLAVYISTGATILVILFMIFVVLFLRKRYKKKSSSLDLSDFPHLALSVDDYKVTPIPRPSVTFPESNRDCLYAYSNETYNRSRNDGHILMQRHMSKIAGKEIDAIKIQKENSKPLEMHTFNRTGVGRNRPDSKSAPDYEYASAGYWDRLKCRGNDKKGVDNPAMRW